MRPRARVGVALDKLIQGGAPPSSQGFDTLIVASSDLSHYHPYDDAVRPDHKVLKAIEEWDYLSMSQNVGGRSGRRAAEVPLWLQ